MTKLLSFLTAKWFDAPTKSLLKANFVYWDEATGGLELSKTGRRALHSILIEKYREELTAMAEAINEEAEKQTEK